MNLSTLRKKALKNDLEVEHILRSARQQVPGLAEELDRLIVDCEWTDGGKTNTGLIIPFRKWAITAATFCRGSYSALAYLHHSDNSYLSFILTLLEELHSDESLNTALTLRPDVILTPSVDLQTAFQLAASLNLLLSFPPTISVNPAQAVSIRSFLYDLSECAQEESERALVLCALRGVGDKDSLAFIASVPDLQYPWHETKQRAIKAIRRKLRAAGA